MMRIVWGLYDYENDILMALFEAENLLVGYREQLLRKWYDDMTKPIPVQDNLSGEPVEDLFAAARSMRETLLDLGYDRWRADEINSGVNARYSTQRYELWNSVPPNPERLVMHFDT